MLGVSYPTLTDLDDDCVYIEGGLDPELVSNRKAYDPDLLKVVVEKKEEVISWTAPLS